MRIPLAKVYRAFPELDRFSDESCRGFVRQARNRHRVGHVVNILVAALLCAAVLAAWYYGGQFVGPIIAPELSVFWEHGWGLALLVAYFFAGPVAGLLTFTFIRDRWLRRTISRQIHDTRCPSCGYSMLGLSIVRDEILCPECGLVRQLADGLSPADFVAVNA